MEPTQPTRLTVAEVERLHALLGGDPVVEWMIQQYIATQWTAPTLLELPWHVAQ